ncbi:hypothetical protein ACFPOI_21765 [Nonomuraea angiospora]|uniref:Sugar phosphate isomerase/epimerase n=1 Tax=Nonomuraea angiospora TaxID=46172 RepID=A0ABR9MK18_9ACTN|nr:hypothetical protein [Nonomuraea angiospora]MBE1593296.1 sugar phosphate isomerase/epimerase [Nonomuraea angiospora]
MTKLMACARGVDGTVLLEPVSGAPRYPLPTADDTVAVLDRLGQAPNAGLVADFHHLAVNGDDVRAAGYRGHVGLEYRSEGPDAFGRLPREQRAGGST